jgi:hypothetical protein
MSQLMKSSRIKILCIVFLVMSLIYPTQAFAGYMTYAIVAYDYFSQTNSYGTFGYNHVENPTVTSAHVSSLYVYDSANNGYNDAENGWVKEAGWSGPDFFAAWFDQGIYNLQLFQSAPINTDHYYMVVNTIGTNQFTWYIDGTQKYSRTFTNYSHGTSLASSERAALGDDNWSHFWDLQEVGVSNGKGNWYLWSNLQQHMNNDPNYHLSIVSNTECYMLHN